MENYHSHSETFAEYPDVVNVAEICKMLGVGKGKVYVLVKSGELQKLPCLRSIKVPKISVINYLLKVCKTQK